MRRETNITSCLLKTLIEKILPIAADMPNYSAAFIALNKVYQYHCQNPSIELKECLDVPQRYGIVCGINQPDGSRLNHAELATNVERYVQAIGRKLTSENRMNEINHFMDNYQLNLKAALFEPALGKVADDGGKYNWSYTEWNLLKDADFTIRPDGKVSIKLADNKGYKEHYALGQRNHGILEREMRCLGNIIGLEFEPGTHFHDEIVFNNHTSHSLIAAGIHLNPAYLRNMLQPKNVGAFFSPQPAAGNLMIEQPASQNRM